MISKFEELIAWQKSRELVTAIYKLTNGKEFSRDFGLRDQIQRAAVSIMSNIAEGFERAGRAEFHLFSALSPQHLFSALSPQHYVLLSPQHLFFKDPQRGLIHAKQRHQRGSLLG